MELVTQRNRYATAIGLSGVSSKRQKVGDPAGCDEAHRGNHQERQLHQWLAVERPLKVASREHSV